MSRRITVTFTEPQADAIVAAINAMFLMYEGERRSRDQVGLFRAADNAQGIIVRAKLKAAPR